MALFDEKGNLATDEDLVDIFPSEDDFIGEIKNNNAEKLIEFKDESCDIEFTDDSPLAQVIHMTLFETDDVELLGNDVVVCADAVNKYCDAENLDISKYLHLSNTIRGEFQFSKDRLPNVRNTDIYNLYLPRYRDLVDCEYDGAVLANITLLEIYGFNIINKLWKELENRDSLVMDYNRVKEVFREYTPSIMNFVLATLKRRDIFACGISMLEGRKNCVYVCKKRMNKQQLEQDCLNCDYTFEVAVDGFLTNNDNVLLQGYIYLLNSLKRYKKASDIMIKYHDNLRKRKRTVRSTLANGRILYKSGVSLFIAYISLYDINIHNIATAYNNTTLDLIWEKLPTSMQEQFGKCFEALYQLYEVTHGLVRDGVDMHLNSLLTMLNELYDKISLNFSVDLEAMACMTLSQEEIDYLLDKELDYNYTDEEIDRVAEETHRNENEDIKDVDGDIVSTSQEERDEIEGLKYNREREEIPNPAKERQKQNNKVFNKVKAHVKEKSDNGDYAEAGKKIAKVSGTGLTVMGKGLGKAAQGAFSFCTKHPKTFAKLVGGGIMCIIMFKLFRFLLFL